MRASRFAYRLLRVRRLLSHSARISGRLDLQQVPEAPAQLLAAGDERLPRDDKEAACRRVVRADGLLRRVNLEGDSGQRLGKRVVDVHGETRAFVDQKSFVR